MDISPETDLSKIFRPLDNNQASDVMLQKEKARLKRKYGHSPLCDRFHTIFHTIPPKL